MIHEIAPHVFDNQYRKDEVPEDDSPVFIFGGENEPAFGGGVLIIRDHHIPVYEELKPYLSGDEKPVYLFSIDGKSCFLLNGLSTEKIGAEAGFEKKSFRDVRNVKEIPDHEYFLAMTALQLHNWYRNNRFCGRCGKEMKPSERERALVCPVCGYTVYPKIAPAVTVAIIDRERDKLLLTQYAGRDIPFYALVAGFTEIGETLEQTVAREAYEETGLKVKNIRYFGSQPWGIVDDLMVGFCCDLEGSNEIHRDEGELKLADWFSREDVVLQPTDMSLTNALMRAFREGRI